MSLGWIGPGYGPEDQPPSPTMTWVDLAKIYIREPGAAHRSNPLGLDLSGEVPGLISAWIPTVDGRWMARVNYHVKYADGQQVERLSDQLVPDYALRPRETDVPLLGLRKRR